MPSVFMALVVVELPMKMVYWMHWHSGRNFRQSLWPDGDLSRQTHPSLMLSAHTPEILFSPPPFPHAWCRSFSQCRAFKVSQIERITIRENVKLLKSSPRYSRIELHERQQPYNTIGHWRLCLLQTITDWLMEAHNIYVQPINYPTVPRGTERMPDCNRHTQTGTYQKLVSVLQSLWEDNHGCH